MDVKVCPKCNSQDVWPDSSFKFEQRAGLQRYSCKNCGYIGPMTVMEKDDANKLDVMKKK